MKLFAPKYYKDFCCIADKCRHSCCIGWEIDIDDESDEKYRILSEGYGKVIRDSVSRDGPPHFVLKENDRCPHLDERGLCRIIINLGEDYLCHICREHPRFYNETPLGMEVGLGMCCEEAARLILGSDGYDETELIGEAEELIPNSPFDSLSHRKKIYSILSDRSRSLTERIIEIEKEYGVYVNSRTEKDWRELLSALEYLDSSHRDMFQAYSENPKPIKELEKPLERALAYFIYRHVTPSENENDLKAAIGFSIFCCRLICSLAAHFPKAPIADLARTVSEELEYSEENTEAIKLEFMF